jgi:hypothetical protein
MRGMGTPFYKAVGPHENPFNAADNPELETKPAPIVNDFIQGWPGNFLALLPM